MTSHMRILLLRYTDPAYNVYCELSVNHRHGLGPDRPGDAEILERLKAMGAPGWMGGMGDSDGGLTLLGLAPESP